MNRPNCVALGAIILSTLVVTTADAEAQVPEIGSRSRVGPSPPVPPATMARSVDGVTVRAVRLSVPLKIDGRLEEGDYATVLPISDFIQQEPHEGEPATEKTEVWIFFDDKNVYVSARCWDSHPERAVATDMRRDGRNIVQNENFSVIFDTFYDKRNGLLFEANSIGGIYDAMTTDERDFNTDWNTVWDARTGKFEQGWTVEIAIPFKSLRYNPGRDQTWGINLRRIVRWKNEVSFLTRVPAFLTQRAMISTSLGATLVGLEAPPIGKNLDLKPYAIASLQTDRGASPIVSGDTDAHIGFDAKYGVTKSLTADFTYNTDFAQVEDDEQQVNLTRFNLLFPEKRDFFLEGRGIFAFGDVGVSNSTSVRGPTNPPIMFFSRRIGLNAGRQVPIRAGGRMTGKAGKYAIGLLNVRTGDEPVSQARATNFSVIRVKRDFMKRSTAGAIYTRRSVATIGDGSAETFGADAFFSFSPSLSVNAYLARTRTPTLTGDDTSYLGQFDYNTDRYRAQFEHVLVGRNFNPEVGFVRRTDFRRNFALLRFSPRPKAAALKAIRKVNYLGSFDKFSTVAGRLDTREVVGSVDVEFQNSDRFAIEYAGTYEFIPQPFQIAANIAVPVGGYRHQALQTSYQLGAQRRVAGRLSYERGSLYTGTKETFGYSGGRVYLSPRLFVEPGVSLNWIALPWGAFTTAVVSTRSTFTPTPRMFVSALVQYNSSAKTLTNNVRLRWEYQPGSEFFLVYSEGRDTLARGFPNLQNRTLVGKVTRLLRF